MFPSFPASSSSQLELDLAAQRDARELRLRQGRRGRWIVASKVVADVLGFI